MKRIAVSLLLAVALLCMPITALAGTFSVSPSSEQTIIVPKDGTTTLDFTFPGYEGGVTVGKENLPLDIAPLGLVAISPGEVLTMTFTGDGTNNTYNGKLTFLASGEEQVLVGIKVRLTVHVNCTTEVIAPTPAPYSGGGDNGGGGAEGIIAGIELDLFGVKSKCYTGYDGGISSTIGATSGDGNLTILIPRYTDLSDKKGRQLRELSIAVNEDPPKPPADANIIGLPYTFEPNGATFDPPMTLTWSYDPNTLPEGIAEGDLVLAFYDEVAGEWVELECTVDTATNTVVATVSHFTVFAIIAVLPTPIVELVPEPVTPTPVVPEPVEEPTPEPVVVPVPEPTPVPTPAPIPEPAPAPPITPEPVDDAGIPWGILIGVLVLGAIVVAILLIRRRKSEA